MLALILPWNRISPAHLLWLTALVNEGFCDTGSRGWCGSRIFVPNSVQGVWITLRDLLHTCAWLFDWLCGESCCRSRSGAQSLVLLKHESSTLPLSKTASIYVFGSMRIIQVFRAGVGLRGGRGLLII
jgi:hypothetical protein